MSKNDNITNYIMKKYKYCPTCASKLELKKREFENEKSLLKCPNCDFVKKKKLN
jgi:uncharacterized Zn finger protein